jgi:hypothetical protein
MRSNKPLAERREIATKARDRVAHLLAHASWPEGGLVKAMVLCAYAVHFAPPCDFGLTGFEKSSGIRLMR